MREDEEEEEVSEAAGELVEEWLRLGREGQAPDIEAFAREHPKEAEALRELLPQVAALEGVRGQRLERAGFLPRPGDRLGEHRIVREIGRGGAGVVFEAEDEKLGRRVAIKVLPRLGSPRPSEVERFRREAATIGRLHHTNIVPLFGVGVQDGLHYHVLQLIRGEGLDRRIERWREQAEDPDCDQQPAGPPSWRDLAGWIRDAALALHHAHQRGVLHRDVKPSNLLLDEEGRIWVSDFGIAKDRGSDVDTATVGFLGTLRYAAPERLAGKGEERSDQFALGLVLYEGLVLRPAFDGRDEAELLAQVTRGRLPTLSTAGPWPRDLATVLACATATDPAHRYPDLGGFAADLSRVLEDRPVRARRVGPLEATWRWCRRNRVVAAATLVALLSLSTATVVGWSAFLASERALTTERSLLAAARDSARDAQRSAEVARRSEAVARTSEQEAEVAQRLAESTLALGLGTLEDLLDDIIGREVLVPLEDGTGDVSVPWTPTLSASELRLMERLLSFYDRFAVVDFAGPELSLSRASALQRVGDIHRLSGRLSEALDNYREGLRALSEDLSGELGSLPADQRGQSRLLKAALHLGEAACHGALGERRAWNAARKAAESALTSPITGSAELEFERRRQLLRLRLAQATAGPTSGLGGRRGRGGPGGPGGRRFLFPARGLPQLAEEGEQLTKDYPGDPRAQLLRIEVLAVSARLQAREAGRASLAQAQSSLAALLPSLRQTPDARALEVLTLSVASEIAPNPRARREALEAAIAQCRRLYEEAPERPDHRSTLALLLQRSAQVSPASELAPGAARRLSRLREAEALLSELADQHRLGLSDAVLLFRIRDGLVRALVKQGETAKAREVLRRMLARIAALDRVNKQRGARAAPARPPAFLERIRRRTQQQLEELQRVAGAEGNEDQG